tara:strand:+ start:361 stop:612 length:252 start_codon:yes stop_codon:yes gene_type:complete
MAKKGMLKEVAKTEKFNSKNNDSLNSIFPKVQKVKNDGATKCAIVTPGYIKINKNKKYSSNALLNFLKFFSANAFIVSGTKEW